MSSGNILTIVVLVVVLLAINILPRWLKKRSGSRGIAPEPKSGLGLRVRDITWDIRAWLRKHHLVTNHGKKTDEKKKQPKAEKKGAGHYVWEATKLAVSLLVSLAILAIIYLNMKGGMFGGFDLWPFAPFPKFMFGG